jgi:uncharacterized protein YacL
MHPEKKAVSIDYGLAIVMLPTVMMGSFIGVIMNAYLPDLILQVLLTLLLAFLTIQSFLKARDIFKKENKKIKEKKKKDKEERSIKRILDDGAHIQVERKSIIMLKDEFTKTELPSMVRDEDYIFDDQTSDAPESIRDKNSFAVPANRKI